MVVLFAGTAQAVPCRVSEPAAMIMTSATATVDDAGGIVAANPPKGGWELSQASTAKTLELRSVAPGLAVIPLPTNGAFELRDTKRAVLATVTRGPVQHKPLPAPKPKAVKLTARRSRGDDTTITATLATCSPKARRGRGDASLRVRARSSCIKAPAKSRRRSARSRRALVNR